MSFWKATIQFDSKSFVNLKNGTVYSDLVFAPSSVCVAISPLGLSPSSTYNERKVLTVWVIWWWFINEPFQLANAPVYFVFLSTFSLSSTYYQLADWSVFWMSPWCKLLSFLFKDSWKPSFLKSSFAISCLSNQQILHCYTYTSWWGKGKKKEKRANTDISNKSKGDQENLSPCEDSNTSHLFCHKFGQSMQPRNKRNLFQTP